MEKGRMDKAKLASLLKETEKSLFRANRQLKAAAGLSGEIGRILQNLGAAEQASLETEALAKELSAQMKQSRIAGQSHELFASLGNLRDSLQKLEEQEDKARFFVEKYRTSRLYSFGDSSAAAKFARQALEIFSVESVLFRPRFVGTVDLNEMASGLNLRKTQNGLLLQPKNIKAFVKHMQEKKFASNISLESAGLRLVWHDNRTVAVNASPDGLYRTDRLCEALQGKCLEK